jgi:preprotein translocase subunit YajC
VQGAQSIIFLVLLMVVFYFMLIRPQKRRVEQHRRLIESVGPGDDIVTIGGMHASVVSVDDDEVVIAPNPGMELRFVKSAIARKVGPELEGEHEDEGSPALEEGES